MDVNEYINNCLMEHKKSGKYSYYILPKLYKNEVTGSTIEYIFTNLHLNNEAVAKEFIYSIVNSNFTPGPIFRGDIIIKKED